MAENKKAVLLYCDLIHTVEELEDDEAGRLFKHYLRYVNDLDPKAPDKITKLVFEPIKQNLKRDLNKWKETQKVRSKAGKASAEKRKLAKLAEQEQIKLTSVECVEQKATNPTVKDTVKDIVIVKDITKKEKVFNFRKSLVDYGFEENLVIDWLKVRKTRKASNTRTAFNGFIKQVEKSNLDKNLVLTECIIRSWSGFKSEWILNSKNIQVKTEKKDAALILQDRYGIK